MSFGRAGKVDQILNRLFLIQSLIFPELAKDSIHEIPIIVKFTKIESRTVVARGLGAGRMGSSA